MSVRRLRQIFVLALFGAAAARAFGLLRPRPAPDVSRHPTVDGGARPPAPAADPYQAPIVEPAAVVPDLAPLAPLEADRVTEPAPDDHPDLAAPAAGTRFDVGVQAPEAPAPETVDPAPAPTDAADDTEPETTGAQTWSAPVDGACPDGFPVKAKLRSGIFHVPGGLAYERTHPDRCYPTPEAAEADGLRAAKR